MLGPLLTSWTIRLALLFYAVVVGAEIVSPRLVRRWGGFRWFWTIACAFFLAHVACAFHFYHHWSPSDAFENTAMRTGQMLGVQFGAGIYFSYFFAVLWTADVAWWWIRRESYIARPWWVSAAIHAYLFFIAFNGAVVFEGGPTRWFATAGVLGLLLLLLARILGRSPAAAGAALEADCPAVAEPNSSSDA